MTDVTTETDKPVASETAASATQEPKRFTKPELYKMTISALASLMAKLHIVVPDNEEYTKDQAIQAVVDKQTELLNAGEEYDPANDPMFQASPSAAPGITASMVSAAASEPTPTVPVVDVKPATALPEVPVDLLGDPVKEETDGTDFTDEMIDKLRGALGFLGLRSKVVKLEDEHGARIGRLEATVAEMAKQLDKSKSLHGSIASLPKLHELGSPGKIDDLPKIG